MRKYLSVLFCALVSVSAYAQTANVQKQISNNRLTGDISVPTGKQLTFESGSALTINSGATVAGLLNIVPLAAGDMIVADSGPVFRRFPLGAVGTVLTSTGSYISWELPSFAPVGSKYIVQTADSTLTGEQSLGALSTGLLLNTVTGSTGVLSSITNSSGLASAISDETGTGVLVFGTSPSFTTQITAPKIVYSGSVIETYGTGTPEGAITADIGSVFHRTDGGSSTTLYVKESGSGNTGWVAYGTGGGGSGAVSSGTASQLAYYASSGTTVSGLSTANNGVLVTNGSGVPSISTTLPDLNAGTFTFSGGGTIGGSSGALTLTAGGSNQNVNISSSGTGYVLVSKSAIGAPGSLVVEAPSGYAAIRVRDQGSTRYRSDFFCSSSGVTLLAYDDIGTTYLPLNLQGSVKLLSYGAGTLTTDGSGNVTATSDIRLKDVKGTYSRGLSEIRQLHPILYSWKSGTGHDDGVYAGFSAQDVEAAIPEAVGQMADGYLTLQDRPIIAALVNANKELDFRLNLLIAFNIGLVLVGVVLAVRRK